MVEEVDELKCGVHLRRVGQGDPQINERHSSLNLGKVAHASLTRVDNQSFTEYARNTFTRQGVRHGRYV